MRQLMFCSLLVATIALGGCGVRTVPDAATVLNVRGPVMVDVESFAGDVTIIADDRLDAAEVRVVRQSRHGSGRDTDAYHSVDDIDYRVSIDRTDRGPVLLVRTWSDNPESHLQRAHVTIRLPAVDGLLINTQHGNVSVKNTSGPTEIHTTGGDVRFMTDHAMLDHVTIVNREGDIDYRVRGESTAAFLAETIDGSVRYRAIEGRVRPTTHTPRRLIATLNAGRNPVELRTVEGSVRIAIVPNPTEVGRYIIDP